MYVQCKFPDQIRDEEFNVSGIGITHIDVALFNLTEIANAGVYIIFLFKYFPVQFMRRSADAWDFLRNTSIDWRTWPPLRHRERDDRPTS